MQDVDCVVMEYVMGKTFNFEGKEVSESKAKEIVTSSSKQSLLELVKDGDISGEFPLT